jgi:hypothetical protein
MEPMSSEILGKLINNANREINDHEEDSKATSMRPDVMRRAILAARKAWNISLLLCVTNSLLTVFVSSLVSVPLLTLKSTYSAEL